MLPFPYLLSKMEKAATKETIESLKHVETGVLQCGHSSRWRGHGHDPTQAHSHTLYTDRTQSFSHPYKEVPQVKVGVQDVTTYGGSGKAFLTLGMIR